MILLDFWATWCPPCQRPMAHNQEMLVKNTGTWGDKVRLVGMSIDNTADAVKSHVEAKGWGNVEHYHVRNGRCTADKEYGVQGVPHCLLLDTAGKIVFIGHPASRNLEQDINDLLAGKTISGAGTTAAGGDDEDGQPSKKCSAAEVGALIEGFKTTAKGIMEDAEVKAAVKGAPRAFLVLVAKGDYDWKTSTMEYKLSHYQVLVGPQAMLDLVKGKAASLRGDDKKWAVIERSQAI